MRNDLRRPEMGDTYVGVEQYYRYLVVAKVSIRYVWYAAYRNYEEYREGILRLSASTDTDVEKFLNVEADRIDYWNKFVAYNRSSYTVYRG